MNGEFDYVALRELAYFTLAGAQLFASDSTCLPSSFGSDERERPGSVWVIAAAGLAWALGLGYLGLMG